MTKIYAVKTNVFIGEFIDQTLHIVGNVNACAPLKIY